MVYKYGATAEAERLGKALAEERARSRSLAGQLSRARQELEVKDEALQTAERARESLAAANEKLRALPPIHSSDDVRMIAELKERVTVQRDQLTERDKMIAHHESEKENLRVLCQRLRGELLEAHKIADERTVPVETTVFEGYLAPGGVQKVMALAGGR